MDAVSTGAGANGLVHHVVHGPVAADANVSIRQTILQHSLVNTDANSVGSACYRMRKTTNERMSHPVAASVAPRIK
jgi:hypothetical protein